MLRVDARKLARLPADVQGQVRDGLVQLEELYERNPLQRFVPMPGQAEYLAAVPPGVRTKMYAGGNRAGKTTVGVVDDLIQAVPVEFLPARLRAFKWCDGPFQGRVIVPSYTALDSVQLAQFRHWGPRDAWRDGSFDRALDKQHRRLRFCNGSVIDFLTFEVDLDKLGGVKLHRVRFDEEPPGEKGRAMFQESRMRIVDYGPVSQVCFTMTPLLGISWAHDEVWERRLEPGFAAVQSSMFDNTHLAEREVRDATRGLTVEERRARIKGEFVHFRGLVYPEFRDRAHVVAPPGRERLAGQEVVVGIDPGVRWTGVLWLAFDADNSAVAFDELLLEGHTVDDVAALVHDRNREWGVRPEYVIDPSARNRNQVNAENVEAAFARNDVFCQHGQNQVQAGVFEVKRRLQQGMLTVSDHCPRLVWELGRYRLDDRADGTFAVVKQDDHLADCLRYAVMSRAWNVPGPPVQEHRRPGWIPGTAPRRPVVVGPNPPLGSMS